MDRLFLGPDNVATNKIVEAVNKILGREVPATNGIPVNSFENNADLPTYQMEAGKKNLVECG